MLIHLIADYGAGDLAAAEVHARLALHVPGADVAYTPVDPFDTIGAGFCVAQLALGEGPKERVVFHNVAPRGDVDDPRPDNEGEPLVVARLANGVLVVGVAAGCTFSFLADSIEELHEVEVPPSGSQFRSRDAFPALLPALLAGDRSVLGRPVVSASLPPVPQHAVAYVDGYGNIKTTWYEPPAEGGSRLQVRIGGVEAEAVVGDGTFDVRTGEVSFAPGSSGWTTRSGQPRRWYELFARGGNAAELFNFPTAGTPIDVVG